MFTLRINALKKQGERYKGKPANSTVSLKRQFNYMNATWAEDFKQFKAWLEVQGRDGYDSSLSHKGEKC